MGKYFKDETLDGLWTRLVASTVRLAGYDGWLTIGDIYSENGYITITHPTGDEFVYPNQGQEGDFVGYLPISIADLNQDTIYYVYSIGGYYLGKIFHKDKISWSVTEIHDILLSHYDLARGTTPITVGNYLKGISVAANYYTNNYEMDTTTENTLAEIVDRLEHSCCLSDDMVLTISEPLYESGFRLFDADTGEQLAQEDNPSDYTTYDLKNYYQFQQGKRYYAIADLVMEYYDEDEDLYYHQNYYIRSNEVVYGPTINYIFTLSDDLYLTGDRPITTGDIYLTLYRNNEPIGSILGAYGDVPYDFLNGDWSGSIPILIPGDYQATISWYDPYGEYVTYTTNVVKFDSGDTEYWLFQDEYMNTTPKTVYDANEYPIVPVVGTSYTLFIDDVEIATNTATDFGGSIGVVLSIVTPDNSVTFAYIEGASGWYFNPTDSKTKSGNVSIRINV